MQRSSIAHEATRWRWARVRSDESGPTREPSSASTRTKGSRRLTEAPSWLVAAGIGVHKAEEEDEPLEDQRKKREVFHAVITVCLVGTVIVQNALLDFYLIQYYKTWLPYLWIIPDVSCVAIFVVAQILSYRYLLHSHFGVSNALLSTMFSSTPVEDARKKRCSTYIFGVLPLSYISWLFYSIILLTKLIIIIMNVAETLKARDFLGFQSFQVTVALAALVFFCLVEGHTWATRTSHRYIFVTLVCAYTALDLIDTVNLMSMLLVYRGDAYHFSDEFGSFVAACCSITFVLPTVYLYLLSMTDRTAEVLELPVTTFNDVIHLLVLDIPYLVIRSYWWVSGDLTVFILLLKNVFFIIVTIRRLVPDVQEMIRHFRYSRKALTKIRQKREELQLEKGLIGSETDPGPGHAPAAATGDGTANARAKKNQSSDPALNYKSNITTGFVSRGHTKGTTNIAGISDEHRGGALRASQAGVAEAPAAPGDEHKPEEGDLETDSESISISLSTLSTLTSSDEPEMADASTQTEGAYSFPVPERPRYVYPPSSRARGRGIESRRREREPQVQIVESRDQEFKRQKGENRELSAEPPSGSRESQGRTLERGGRGVDRRGGPHSRARRGVRRRNRGYKSPGRGLEGRGRDVERRRRGYGSPGGFTEGRGRYIERGERRHESPGRSMQGLGRDTERRDRGYKSPGRGEAGRERNVERGDASPGRGVEGHGRDRERRQRGVDGRGQGLEGQDRDPERRGENRVARREAGEGRGRDREGQRQEESGRRRGRQEESEREQGRERDHQLEDARDRSDESRGLGRRARGSDERIRIREPARGYNTRDSPQRNRSVWR